MVSADIDQSRLEMAKSFGADVIVNTRDKNLKDVRCLLTIINIPQLHIKGIVSKLTIKFWMCQKCGKMKDYNKKLQVVQNVNMIIITR
jgi:Zn-dependent alcohol dehydrogenase